MIDLIGGRCVDHRATEFGGAGNDHLACFRPLLRQNNRHRLLENARFLAGNFPKRMAEKILMIEVDAGDDRNHGRENVRGVQAPSESYLEDGKLDSPLRKILKSHSGYALEIGGMRA